jgi:uncharacterized protein DUF4383
MTKNVVMLLGIIFVLLGILGFFSENVLGIFHVNGTHNWVHLLSGVVAIVMSMRGEDMARMYAKVFGVVYAIVTVLGFMSGNVLGLFPVNGADNFLHLVLAVVLLWAGFMKRHSSSTMMPPPPSM